MKGTQKHSDHSAKHKIGDVGFEVGIPFGVRDLKKEINLILVNTFLLGSQTSKSTFSINVEFVPFGVVVYGNP